MEPTFFERDYFDHRYRDYERQNPDRKLKFYVALAELASPAVEHPRILDFGCAMGLFLRRLGSAWRRYGVDASEYAVSLARERAPEADVRVARGSEFAFDLKFDVVTAFDVLEHLEDPGRAIDRISVLLNPGGGFVMVVPVYDGPTGPLIRLLDRDPTHLHKRSRDFWLRLPGSNFSLRDWWGIYRYLIPGGPYMHIVTRKLRRFTPAIACVFRRLGSPPDPG